MALINCPECGKEISDKTSACIGCGCPIANGVINQDVSITSQNIVSKICKVLSVIIFITSFICTLFICKEISYEGLYSNIEEFNLTLAIPIWVGSFIYCLFMYAIGEIISILEKLKRI